MTEVKDNVGIIEVISSVKEKEISWNKAGKQETATIYEIGIKLGDGSWHNISGGSPAKAEAVLKDSARDNTDFVVGDEVKIYSEDKKGSGYFKVTSICLIKQGSGSTTTTNKPSENKPIISPVSRDEYFRKKDNTMTKLGCLRDALAYIEIKKDLGEIKEVKKEQIMDLAQEFYEAIVKDGGFNK